jgi:hypothetical protein
MLRHIIIGWRAPTIASFVIYMRSNCLSNGNKPADDGYNYLRWMIRNPNITQLAFHAQLLLLLQYPLAPTRSTGPHAAAAAAAQTAAWVGRATRAQSGTKTESPNKQTATLDLPSIVCRRRMPQRGWQAAHGMASSVRRANGTGCSYGQTYADIRPDRPIPELAANLDCRIIVFGQREINRWSLRASAGTQLDVERSDDSDFVSVTAARIRRLIGL